MSNITKFPTKRSALAVQAMREFKRDLIAENGVLPRVDENTKLIPLDACHAIVEKIDAEYQPAGEGEHTTNAVAFLLGGFPQSVKSAEAMENPKIYMAHVVRVYSKYPATLHTKATDTILGRHTFKPSIAEITAVFEELVGNWTCVQISAEKHIREHNRRTEAAKREELLAQEREGRGEFIKSMRDKHGDKAVGFVENLNEAAQQHRHKVKPTEEELKSFAQDRAELDRKAAELLGGQRA